MKNYLPLCFLILISGITTSCENNDISTDFSLEGAWVNTKVETDILIFYSDPGPRQMFELKRNKEVKNGQLVPKHGTGLYEFKIEGQTISIYNMISSCYCFKDYFFDRSGTSLFIGNFYDDDLGDVQTFRKVK